MAIPVTAPKTTPEPGIAAKAQATAAAAAQTGHRLLRPVRYGAAFVNGTVRGFLDGIANWGSRGLKWGLVAGVAAWMAPATIAALGWTSLAGVGVAAAGITGGALLPALVVFGGGAFLAAMAIGGTYGLLTGGAHAVGRVHRSEKYADDLVVRKQVREAAPPNLADYRAHRKAMKTNVDNDLSRYMLERRKEDATDYATYHHTNYWRDREHANRAQASQAKGADLW